MLKAKDPMQPAPSISIIIPTYSRPKQLEVCLTYIAAIEYEQARREVVVVDDGSIEKLDSLVKPFISTLNLNLIRQSNRGPAAARNNGVKSASGEIVAFTDDDCMPDKGWLNGMVAALDLERDRAVGGRTENQLKDNCYSQASHLLIEYLYELYSENHSEMQFFTSNNFACFRDTFHELGGFSEEFKSNAAEDRDFCRRWQQAGKTLCFAPNAIIFHAHQLSFSSFLRQHSNYGQGAYTFHKLRAADGDGSLKIEPFHFYANLIHSPFAKQLDQAALFSLLIGLSQLANASGFFTEMAKRKLRFKNSAVES